MLPSNLHASARMNSVQTPIIPTVAKLISDNPGTISLGQGVVYYGPPQSAIDALNQLNTSIENHKYGSVEGRAELLALISSKLQQENRINIGRDYRIVVTAGANMAFLNALFAITDPGDEIILPLPYYFNHEMAITMMNCKAVIVPTDDDYQLCNDKIRAAVNDKTRAIVTVSPNNPSGAVYPKSILQEINSICLEHNIYHISDEAYEYFTYNGVQHFSPASQADTKFHTISLFSLSKAYGFASWRIGYMVVPEHLFSAVTKAQDTNLICPTMISQYAAIGAMSTGSDYCRKKIKPIGDIREMMLEELNALNDTCNIPHSDGAFYLLIKVHTDIEDMEIVIRLIKEYKVAVIPGHTFGMKDGCYLRVAYGALEKDTAADGIRRLVNGLTSII
ncbi:MAG: pyridoxal phosphate-dependent aminotransferase [Gammaproteobacteria bacterium]